MFRFILLFSLLIPYGMYAQLGGSRIYEFVNTSTSAHEHALAGNIISIDNNNVAFALKNPAILDSTYSGNFSAGWGSFHVLQTDIGAGTFAYSHNFSNINILFGMHMINYGRFSAYNEHGISEGTFFASDYEVLFGASYEIFPLIYAGYSCKPIFSFYESYSSIGLLNDFAVSYKNKADEFTASFIIKNAGFQITQYTENTVEKVPLSIDFGVSKKLSHAPFRLTFTYEGLHDFDLSYTKKLEETHTLINQEDTAPSTFDTFSRNLMNHIHLGADLMLFKSLHAHVGYNFRKAYEMAYGASNNGVGFGFGISLNVSYFSLTYGLSKQHVAGSTHFFTCTTNIQKIYTNITN
ncbi:MAG: type IX secretion system protein PorQ [Bacteroidales bacterium]